MLAKPKETSMRTSSHSTTLPHPFPQPRRSRLLFTALLLGGMSILAACQMTAEQLAAMKHRYPGTSDSELQTKWDDMPDSERNRTVSLFEINVGANLRKAASEDDSDRKGGGDGGGGH